jgi:hypothetical protein
MPNDEKIDVRAGGTVSGNFKWKNSHSKQTTASGLSTCLTQNSYPVPGAANGKDGEKDASLNANPAASCTYQWSDDDTETTGSATLTVSRPVPHPMKK